MEKPSASVYVGCMNVMNTVTHVLMGGAGFFGIAIGEMGFLRKFSAHTFLSVIGLTILCSQAILLVNPYRGSKDSLKYSKKTKTYWIVQIVGCSLVFIGACLGISLVADFYKHFSSPHGVMGKFLSDAFGFREIGWCYCELNIRRKIK
ncbi:hypothetical protein HF086_013030 [Spodoptera exigua]|uniref:Cytochrome b561 domain-containing protein n=1 Tax=Spodoptera exigua TaxID=7107 RepID=A0A922MR59_SPOEX|nr:hypothetical protein HF086_013030 [Spodoptera exigua]